MQLPDTLTDWMLIPEVWVIVAIVLVSADLVIGFYFFVLSVGVAAAIVAALLFGHRGAWFGDIVLFETWRSVGTWFAILSVASIFLIRWAFQRRRRVAPDINDY